MTTRFLLNDKLVSTDLRPGTLLLDFIRYHQHLTGTKIGCREGDCGACTIICGELRENDVHYRTMTSCLMPLGNAAGKHIVTIEGINHSGLNPVHQAMHDEAATQCGFCTPGIVVSLAGYCLQDKNAATTDAISAVDGNICRCTGYKSIERAASRVQALMQQKNGSDTIGFLTERSVLPTYFNGVKDRLKLLNTDAVISAGSNRKYIPAEFIGGGTDLYVQQHHTMVHKEVNYLFSDAGLKGVERREGKCIIGASATVSDLIESPVFMEHFPGFSKFSKLISSTPIRNMATIAGNFVNASPIGDLTIIFLALDATLVIARGDQTREIPLRQFYKGYKRLGKTADEHIRQIWFNLPGENSFFNFEKVSKRTYLDIASVNTALQINMMKGVIVSAYLSAGGVAAVPLFLTATASFLAGKEPTAEVVEAALETAGSEISPISDARGTATYKRLLLRQLLKAHFLTMFPDLYYEELLHV